MKEKRRSCMTSARGPCSPEIVNCWRVLVTELVRFCACTPTLRNGVIV
jgi:hypothetical protein